MKTEVRAKSSFERGSSIIAFLIIAAFVSAIVVTALKVASSATRSVKATAVRSTRYYQSESGMNRALAWMRQNSQNLLKPFTAAQFYSSFTRTAPSNGSNDTGDYAVPTQIKLRGTTQSALLTNNAVLGTSAFPATSNIITNASFDAVGSFGSTELDGALVRITLVDALPLDVTKDAPPLAAAQTDFFPVYRIDAMNAPDRGSHVYGYVSGSLYYVDTVGFYGRDFVNVNQNCTSATFTANNPGPTNAKCPVGSNGEISIANNAKIFGSARSNVGVDPEAKVCADYPNCTNPGTTCEGSSCNVPGLPTFGAWSSYCPTSHGDYTVAANANKILVTAGCYDTVTINNKGSLTLQTTTTPYFFKSLNIVGGNAQTQLKVAPSPSDGTVTLYVQTIVGDIINGNQAINPTGKPSQFRLNYLGTNDIKLNGNANFGMAFTSPNAGVTVQGSGVFNGGIIAKSLNLTGSATVMYDESLGGSYLSDENLKLRQMVERYR